MGIVDSLAGKTVNFVIDIKLEEIELGFSRIEKTHLIEQIKQDYHVYVSTKAANYFSGMTTPSVGSSDRKKGLDGKKGEEWLNEASNVYDNHQSGIMYKMQRKLQDKARAITKKPMDLVKIPLGFLPLGAIASQFVDFAINKTEKLIAIRRSRKKGMYQNEENRKILEASLGTSEYLRKSAKWQAKDISALGPALQRNLYKLKQSVEVLNARKQKVNNSVRICQHNNLDHNVRTLLRDREQAAMSLYEVKHYITKITQMCDVMERFAFTTKAYMDGLNLIADESEKDILNSFL